MEKKEIGPRLRAFRESKDMKAKDVSDLLLERFSIELNYKTIYDYENGRTSPNPNVLLALCDIYGVSNPLVALNVSADLSAEMMDAPLSHVVGVGHWMDESLLGDDFTEDEWMLLKKYAEFLLYLRKHPSK